MIDRTFCHLTGLRRASEERLWQRGVLSWDDWMCNGYTAVSPAKAERIREQLADSRQALTTGDVDYFLKRLPAADRPRLFADFADQTAFVDIETDGLHEGARITTVALYQAGTVRVFIRGYDLEEFPNAVSKAGMLVTYFGTRFDLPILRQEFRLPFAQPHLDLCPTLHAWGHFGGLKTIEQQLRLAPRTVGALDGGDAVRLWHHYLSTNNREILAQLLRYNAWDVVNLVPLLSMSCGWSMASYPLPAYREFASPWLQPQELIAPWGTVAL